MMCILWKQSNDDQPATFSTIDIFRILAFNDERIRNLNFVPYFAVNKKQIQLLHYSSGHF